MWQKYIAYTPYFFFFTQNIKKTFIHPAIPPLSIYPEKTITQKDTYIPMFIATLFTVARTWKQPGCPSAAEWIRTFWYMYTIEYYSAIKKEMHLSQF